MDRLPKNGNGKIDRSLLKQLFRTTAETAGLKECSEAESIEV
jgi:acyl-coenzyme A synthetase/AMP-(fatty) acid ligase